MFRPLNTFLAVLLGAALLCLPAAVKPPSSDSSIQKQAETELLSLHKDERRAHFDHDVKFLLVHVAPQLLDVRDGKVNRMSRDDVRDKFEKYFKQSQFSAWDDVEPPIVRASSDGKIGWMIVPVRIAYNETDASGRKISQNTVGAWMSAYEKQNGTWVMTAASQVCGAAHRGPERAPSDQDVAESSGRGTGRER